MKLDETITHYLNLDFSRIDGRFLIGCFVTSCKFAEENIISPTLDIILDTTSYLTFHNERFGQSCKMPTVLQ